MVDLGFSEAAQSVIITDETNAIQVKSFIDTLSDTNFALLVRSLLVGRDSGGSYENVLVDSNGNVGIFASSLPLPTGAATSALQTTGNVSLASIDGKISLNYGVATAAIRVAAQIGNASAVADFNAGNSSAQTLRVVVASNQVVIPVGGNVASAATDSGNPVKIGAVFTTTQPTVTTGQRVNLQATSRGALIVAAGADPFVISLPTGASTSALQTTGNASLASIDGKIVQDFGVSTAAIRVASLLGNASGIASFNAGITDAQTLRVVLPTDQTAIPVTQSTSPWVISASSLPLPTGAATEATLSAINNKLSLDFGVSSAAIRTAALIGNPSGLAAFGSGPTTAQTLRVVLPSDQPVISVNATLSAELYTSYSPDYSSYDSGSPVPLITDASGRLETHSTILTDEGSFRDDFTGSSLSINLTGTVTFTNGSNIVTGSGTSFTTLNYYNYIKLSTDGNTAYAQIAAIIDDTNLELTSPYSGTSGSGVANYSQWIPSIGSGASLTVASSFLNIISGTTNGSMTSIKRFGDYLPYYAYTKFSISQRIANQTLSWGFADDPNNPIKQAQFVFNGTNDKQVICRSSFGSLAGDVQSTTVTLTGSFSTASAQRYEIDITSDQVNFLINGNIVATHTDHLPGPYDNLNMWFYVSNSAAVTSTTMSVDYLFFSNTNQVEITNNFSGEPIPTRLYGTSTATGLLVPLQLDSNGNLIVSPLGGVGADFTFGDVATSGTTAVAMRRTAYTEPTTNGQRSFASSSANDTAAGTGARQVTLIYFDQTGAGPFTEIVTLNGTTRAVTTNTNICFIEEIRVTSVGSGASNAGTITLFTQAAGGTAIGTIGVGANQTFWAHHYVAVGKTCRVSGISGATDQTSSAYALIFLRSQSIPVGNNSDLQISDTSRVFGGAAPTVRNYNSPIPVVGPARITMYVQPSSNSAQNTYGSFDFTES